MSEQLPACDKCGGTDIYRRYRRQAEQWDKIFGDYRCFETEHIIVETYTSIAKCECLTHCCRMCGYAWTTGILPPPDVAALTAERDRLRNSAKVCEWKRDGDGGHYIPCGDFRTVKPWQLDFDEDIRRDFVFCPYCGGRLSVKINCAATANPPPCCADCGGELSVMGDCENNACKSHDGEGQP